MHLQRTAGNRAASRILQRVSQAAQLRDAADDTARAGQLAGLSPVDLADTVFDPAAAATVGSPGLRAAVDALPAPAGPRVKAALTAATGPWEEPFYYSLGLLDGPSRDAIWNALKVAKPQLATATARSAAMNSALSGFVRSGAIPDALKLLNGYSMPDLLDMLTYADGAGYLTRLKVGLTYDAAGIDPARLEAAMLVVRTRPVLTVLAQFGVPLDQGGQDALIKALEDRKAGDRGTVADPAADPAAKEKSERGAAALSAARGDLETLFFLLQKSVAPADIGAMNAYVNEAGIGGFRKVIGDDRTFTQGQFVLSSAAEGQLGDIVKRQSDALTGLDEFELAAVKGGIDGLFGALSHVYVGNASATFAAVARSAQLCLQAFQAAAGAHKIPLSAEFRTALRQTVPAPKDGEAFNKAMEREWRPAWDTWLRTKAMPDMKAEGNAYRLAWLKMADQWACQPMTMKMAELYDAKAAGTPDARVDPKDPEAAKKRQAAAIPFTQLYTGPGTSVTRGPRGRVTDERVVYRKDLGATIEKIRKALDLGWFIHVRVLSGVAMDYTSSRAAGEHSLLIVGCRGNAFFCSDADPGGEGSSIQYTGSTTLFYDAGGNTFATAAEEAMTVDESGHQISNYRHRYQAWTVQTK